MFVFFFFNDTATTEIYTLSLHDALPICSYDQAIKLYEVLKSPKTYLEFTEAEGASQHCQMGAVMISNEQILNWLDERMHPEEAVR